MRFCIQVATPLDTVSVQMLLSTTEQKAACPSGMRCERKWEEEPLWCQRHLREGTASRVSLETQSCKHIIIPSNNTQCCDGVRKLWWNFDNRGLGERRREAWESILRKSDPPTHGKEGEQAYFTSGQHTDMSARGRMKFKMSHPHDIVIWCMTRSVSPDHAINTLGSSFNWIGRDGEALAMHQMHPVARESNL